MFPLCCLSSALTLGLTLISHFIPVSLHFCLSLFFLLIVYFPPVFLSSRPPVDQCQQDTLCSFLLRLPKLLRFIVASRGWNNLLLPTVFQQLPCEAELGGWSFRGNYDTLRFPDVRHYSFCRYQTVYQQSLKVLLSKYFLVVQLCAQLFVFTFFCGQIFWSHDYGDVMVFMECFHHHLSDAL